VIVAVGRHFAHVTDAGRRWPSATSWDADLVLDDFASARDALAPERAFQADAAALCRLFDPVPVAILRATIAARGRHRRPVRAAKQPALAE
jgi:hypothetical protein